MNNKLNNAPPRASDLRGDALAVELARRHASNRDRWLAEREHVPFLNRAGLAIGRAFDRMVAR